MTVVWEPDLDVDSTLRWWMVLTPRPSSCFSAAALIAGRRRVRTRSEPERRVLSIWGNRVAISPAVFTPAGPPPAMRILLAVGRADWMASRAVMVFSWEPGTCHMSSDEEAPVARMRVE